GASPAPPPDPATVETSLFLIGDAGAPAPGGEPVLRGLVELAGKAPGRRLVAFLGDNIYPRGMPDSTAPGRAEAERRLEAQLDAVAVAGARAIFVPGNHDWAGHGSDGWQAMRRQGAFIARRAGGRAELLPADGCPGPEVVDVGRWLRLVALDTQWWLHHGPKPRSPEDGCRVAERRGVARALEDAVGAAGDRRVIVLAHHPLLSGGEHGGYFGAGEYLFPLRNLARWLWLPLPGVGSLYPLSREEGVSPQDFASPSNRRMRLALERALVKRGARPLAWASGHDHELQVLDGRSARYLLVSGAGIYGHESEVFRLRETRFAASAPGFMRLDVLHDGRVRLGVIAVDRAGRPAERFSMWLE